MKKCLYILCLIFLFPLYSYGINAGVLGTAGQSVAAGEPPAAYIYQEGFDGSSNCYSGDSTYQNCDNSEKFTHVGTAETRDYNDTTAGNSGTYNFELQETINSYTASLADLGTGYTALNAYFKFQKPAAPSQHSYFFSLRDAGDANSGMYCRMQTDGDMECYHGASTENFMTGSFGTWYHFWITWTAGTGSDGTLNIKVCTSADKTTGCEDMTPITDGSGNATVQFLQLRSYEDDSGASLFDDIIVDDETIGANPF